jgi:heme oxygenase
MEQTKAVTRGDLFLAKLRATTLPAHKELEALSISERIMHPGITKDEYALYLALMSRVVIDIEENIFPKMGHALPDITQRRKKDFIQADLQFLSAGKTFTDYPFQDAGYTFSPAFAMGMMYVIEGSTLGGRVILKNTEKALGYNSEEGGKYFAGYGAQTGPLWKAFLDIFTGFAEPHNEEDIIAGANFAFSTIHNYLQKNS